MVGSKENSKYDLEVRGLTQVLIFLKKLFQLFNDFRIVLQKGNNNKNAFLL